MCVPTKSTDEPSALPSLGFQLRSVPLLKFLSKIENFHIFYRKSPCSCSTSCRQAQVRINVGAAEARATPSPQFCRPNFVRTPLLRCVWKILLTPIAKILHPHLLKSLLLKMKVNVLFSLLIWCWYYCYGSKRLGWKSFSNSTLVKNMRNPDSKHKLASITMTHTHTPVADPETSEGVGKKHEI